MTIFSPILHRDVGKVVVSLAMAVAIPAIGLPAFAQGAAATTVIVVRHAEKGDDEPTDPKLSVAGAKRAEALAVALADSGVGSIITTHLKRTQMTVAPLSGRTGVKPTVLTVKRGDTAGHISDVIAAVAAARVGQTGAIVVVGHSNTVPLIVKALSGVAVGKLCDWQHADLFTVTLGATGKEPARLVRAKYGEPDATTGADCR